MKTLKITAGIVVTLALIVGIPLAILFGTGVIKMGTADFRGQVDATEQVKADGSYRIAAYDSFYDQCMAIQAKEHQIENLEAEHATGVRKSIVDASITALRNSRAEAISKYNADARKEATEGQFRASDLPYRININEEKTTC